MRIFAFLLFVIYFGINGCMTSKKIIDSFVPKGSQKKGTVLHLQKKSKEGLMDDKEFYFKTDGLNYFIKFSESKIRPDDLIKYIDKTVVIEGEIKNGLWEDQKSGKLTSNDQPKKARSGLYISIDKILEKKDLIP